MVIKQFLFELRDRDGKVKQVTENGVTQAEAKQRLEDYKNYAHGMPFATVVFIKEIR